MHWTERAGGISMNTKVQCPSTTVTSRTFGREWHVQRGFSVNGSVDLHPVTFIHLILRSEFNDTRNQIVVCEHRVFDERTCTNLRVTITISTTRYTHTYSGSLPRYLALSLLFAHGQLFRRGVRWGSLQGQIRLKRWSSNFWLSYQVEKNWAVNRRSER